MHLAENETLQTLIAALEGAIETSGSTELSNLLNAVKLGFTRYDKAVSDLFVNLDEVVFTVLIRKVQGEPFPYCHLNMGGTRELQLIDFEYAASCIFQEHQKRVVPVSYTATETIAPSMTLSE